MAVDAYELDSELLGPLPVINHFLARMGLVGSLERFVPHDDARLRLAPAAVLGVVVRNLVTHPEPVYALGEWAAAYDPALLDFLRRPCGRPRRPPGGADAGTALRRRSGQLVDRVRARRGPRVRHRLLPAARRLHVGQFHGARLSARRGGNKVPAVSFGHNKDHRPDLRQLVWILTVSADGAVPIAYRVEPGNTNDDVTHIPTWDELVALVGRADFLYVSDGKLASTDAVRHIDATAAASSPSCPPTAAR